MQIQPRRHFAGLMTVLVLSCSIAGAADQNAPENKPGYTKSKDVGAAATCRGRCTVRWNNEVHPTELGNVAQAGHGNFLVHC